MSYDFTAALCETRLDRSYDEQRPSTILLPDGSRVSSLSRALNGAALREAFKQWATP